MSETSTRPEGYNSGQSPEAWAKLRDKWENTPARLAERRASHLEYLGHQAVFRLLSRVHTAVVISAFLAFGAAALWLPAYFVFAGLIILAWPIRALRRSLIRGWGYVEVTR